MSSKRTYAIQGINAARIIFSLNGGHARLSVDFTDGSTFNKVPATFTTIDPACQAAIESDPRFGKSIKLISVYNLEADGSQQPNSEPQATKQEAEDTPGENGINGDAVVVEDVTDINGVVQYLREKCKVPHQALHTPEGIRKKVAENNLYFPNVVFPE